MIYKHTSHHKFNMYFLTILWPHKVFHFLLFKIYTKMFVKIKILCLEHHLVAKWINTKMREISNKHLHNNAKNFSIKNLSKQNKKTQVTKTQVSTKTQVILCTGKLLHYTDRVLEGRSPPHPTSWVLIKILQRSFSITAVRPLKL